MTARLGVAWLDNRIHAVWPDDALDDLDDYLAGNDDAIVEREQARKHALVAEVGGEVG